MSSYICYITRYNATTLNFEFNDKKGNAPVIKGTLTLRVFKVKGKKVNFMLLDKTIKSFWKNMFLIPDQCQPDDLCCIYPKKSFLNKPLCQNARAKNYFFCLSQKNLKILKIRNSGPSLTVPPFYCFLIFGLFFW